MKFNLFYFYLALFLAFAYIYVFNKDYYIIEKNKKLNCLSHSCTNI